MSLLRGIRLFVHTNSPGDHCDRIALGQRQSYGVLLAFIGEAPSRLSHLGSPVCRSGQIHLPVHQTRYVPDSARERARKSGRLRAAFVAQAANEYTPLIMRAFGELYQNVSVVLRQLGTSEVAEALRQGSADVAILRLPIATDGLIVNPLFCEQRVVVLPADHPLANRQSLSIGDLLDEPWIINSTEDPAYQAFARGAAHRNPNQSITVGATIYTVGEYLEAVVARQGIGLAPESATRYYSHPGIAYVPVLDVEPSVAALA